MDLRRRGEPLLKGVALASADNSDNPDEEVDDVYILGDHTGGESAHKEHPQKEDNGTSVEEQDIPSMELARSSSKKRGGFLNSMMVAKWAGRVKEAFNVPLVFESTPCPRTNPKVPLVSVRTTMMTKYYVQCHILYVW